MGGFFGRRLYWGGSAGAARIRVARPASAPMKNAETSPRRFAPGLLWLAAALASTAPVTGLAQETLELKQHELAVRYYGLFAGTSDAIADLYLRSVDYGGVTTKLQEEIDRLQKTIDDGDPIDVNVLRGLGAAYEGLGNFRASQRGGSLCSAGSIQIWKSVVSSLSRLYSACRMPLPADIT